MIRTAMDSLEIIDSLISIGYTGGTNADVLNQQISNAMSSNEAIRAAIHQIQSLRIEASIDDNADIPVSDNYEENEAKVNEIYLSTVASGEFELSVDQRDALQLIAEQCPFSGGPSVYLARSIYHLADPTADWDDDAICLYNGIQPRLAKPQNNFILFPNPTTGMITIKYQINVEENGMLLIYNSLGVLISSTKLFSENNQAEVDLSEFNPAVYHYKFVKNNIITRQGIITIIK
jgi:hypothetical protein